MIERKWWGAALLASACVTVSSPKNYSVDYELMGPEDQVKALNRAARAAFGSEDAGVAASTPRIVLDPLPSGFVLNDELLVAPEDAGVTVLGSVELTAMWNIPTDDAQVLPALQRAVSVSGADLAYCPRADRPKPHVWTCHLIRVLPPAPDAGVAPATLVPPQDLPVPTPGDSRAQ